MGNIEFVENPYVIESVDAVERAERIAKALQKITSSPVDVVDSSVLQAQIPKQANPEHLKGGE